MSTYPRGFRLPKLNPSCVAVVPEDRSAWFGHHAPLWTASGTGGIQQSPNPNACKGVPMNRIGIFVAVSLFLLFTVVACDVLDRKPNTSAPGADNVNDLLQACQERQAEIDDWQDKEERKLEDEIGQGNNTVLGLMVKLDRIRQDAAAMRDELRSNCRVKRQVLEATYPATESPGGNERLPTVTPLGR